MSGLAANARHSPTMTIATTASIRSRRTSAIALIRKPSVTCAGHMYYIAQSMRCGADNRLGMVQGDRYCDRRLLGSVCIGIFIVMLS
jgi:hypothetical protein